MNFGVALNVVKEVGAVTAIVVAVASADNTAAKITGFAATVLNRGYEITRANVLVNTVKNWMVSKPKEGEVSAPAAEEGFCVKTAKTLQENALVRAVFTATLALVAYKFAHNSQVVGFAGRYVSQAASFVTSRI